MAQQIEIESPIPPSVLLAQLAVYGKEWRESKIPPVGRAKGSHACHITMRDEAFVLKLSPQGRGPAIVWRGQVSPGREGIGSHVRVRAHEALWSIILTSVWLAVMFAWWATPQILGATPIFGIVDFGVMLAWVFAMTAWRASSQAPICRAILLQVAGGASELRPLAT